MATAVGMPATRGPRQALLERAWTYSRMLDAVLSQASDSRLAARTESLILSITRSLDERASVQLPRVSLPKLIGLLRVLAENPRCTPALAREAVDLAHALVGGHRWTPAC